MWRLVFCLAVLAALCTGCQGGTWPAAQNDSQPQVVKWGPPAASFGGGGGGGGGGGM